jgi:hypothetical protein
MRKGCDSQRADEAPHQIDCWRLQQVMGIVEQLVRPERVVIQHMQADPLDAASLQDLDIGRRALVARGQTDPGGEQPKKPRGTEGECQSVAASSSSTSWHAHS